MEQKDNRLVDVSLLDHCFKKKTVYLLQFIGHRSVITTVNPYWHIDVEGLHKRLVFPWTNTIVSETAFPLSSDVLHKDKDKVVST